MRYWTAFAFRSNSHRSVAFRALHGLFACDFADRTMTRHGGRTRTVNGTRTRGDPAVTVPLVVGEPTDAAQSGLIRLHITMLVPHFKREHILIVQEHILHPYQTCNKMYIEIK